MNLHNRRGFLQVAMGVAALTTLTCFSVESESKPDWLEAFRATGFDPAAAGNSVFVVCGDVHEPDFSEHFPSQIEAWNAMRPAPRFVALLGDNGCSVSRNFGHTPDEKGLAQARIGLEGLRAKLARLDAGIPLKLVIGNHDTMPGETDAAFFRTVFPACRPYEAFEESGIRFMVWNGGHDGGIDLRQREWIRAQTAAMPRDASAVVLIHQPSLGMTERERGIPAMVCEAFAEHTGPLWLLAGHVHNNTTTVFSLPKTKIVQVAHVKSIKGYWIYGMSGGRISARIYGAVGKGFISEALPDLTQPARPIPLPFAGRDDVLWRLLLGEDEALTKAAFVSGKGGNCGTWWFYVDELVVRLPLATAAPSATRFAVLAALSKHRKTGEPTRMYASADGETWTETPLLQTQSSVTLYAIPEGLRNSRELFVKVKSFGYNADTCVGGFALCR